VDWVDHQECAGNVPGSTDREEACSEGGTTQDIQILGYTAFDDLLAREEVIGSFFLRVGDCRGLLEVTIEGIAEGGKIGPRRWIGKQRAASVVAAEERPHGNLE
jgi:hypothetical protein